MSKDYNVDDILSEIKAKKSRQNRVVTTAQAETTARVVTTSRVAAKPATVPEPSLPKTEWEAPATVPPVEAFSPPKQEEPPVLSVPLFTGFDASAEPSFSFPEETPPPNKSPAGSDYQKYFKSIEQDQKAEPEPKLPKKDSPLAEGELDVDSIFATGYIFPQAAATKEAPAPPQGKPIFDTTLFDKPNLSSPSSQRRPLEEAGEEDGNSPALDEVTLRQAKSATAGGINEKFKITLPDDIMLENDTPGLFPPEQEEKPSKESKRKNLFSRTRSSGSEEETPSRLASSEVPVPEAFSEDSDEIINDYSSPEDKEAILRDMKSIKFGLFLRMGLLLIIFVISLYLALASRDLKINAAGDLLPLLDLLWPETHFRTYMIVSTAIAALSALICSNTVGGGLLALLKFHANTDSLPALAVLGALGQGICFIVKPEFFNPDKAHFAENLYFFFPVAIFILFFNLLGKLMVILRIQNNFKLVAADKVKYSLAFLKEKNILRELTKGLSMEEYTVAYPEKAQFLKGFLDNSYSEDHAEAMSRILAPLCLLAAVALAVIAYLFHKNIPEAVSTFAAVLCICAPLTSTIAANLPLLRLSHTMIPMGAMVSGYSAVEAFSHTEAVVLGACDIFKPENVILHGIKPFDQGKIDAVILDAASVVCSTNGMLTAVFSKMIASKHSILKPVENIAYEDSMGLSAWVDGKRVLIGNRELMQNHGIDLPSNDYELRYVKDSKNIIYLANSGTLSAMFVISYNPNSAVREKLDQLAQKGLYLIVETSDPNITAEKIHEAYDFPIDLIRLLPAKFHSDYMALTAEKPQAAAKIALLSPGKNIIETICACSQTRSAVETSVLIQMIALVMGYGLVALFALMGNLPTLSLLYIFLFQILWALLGILLPNLRRIRR